MTHYPIRRRGGWPTSFRDLGWAYVIARLEESPGPAGLPGDLQHLLAIARSVVDRGRADDLAVSTGMLCSLVVTPTPLGIGRHDVVRVVAPNEIHKPPPAGQVRIEHHPVVGIADSITRSTDDAVPLFWRFMYEKYGIAPEDA